MKTTHLRHLRPLAAALTTAAALACGADLTLPDPSGLDMDLVKVRGDTQQGPVGEALAEPLVVRVVTGDQPVVGRQIAFVAPEGESGYADPDTATTNSDGEALTTWVLGPETGAHEIEARLVTEVPGGPVTRFQATAVAAGPDTLRAVSPLFQPGRRGETLDDPLVVAVVDRFGNPVADYPVAWQVTAGEGSLSAEETRTDAAGTASVTWTLGGRIGVQKVTATVAGASGSPVTFSATVLF